jgi:hypothetical protein
MGAAYVGKELSMPYAIAKRAYDGESASYVTAIRKGGLSIDSVRIWNDRIARDSWQVRKWTSKAAADKAQAQLAGVGGYDDYLVIDLED